MKPPVAGTRSRSSSFTHQTGRGRAPPSAPALLSAKLQAELTENFHFVTVPLMILATVAVGLLLVYLKDVLVPFVIGVFLV